ncbi:hypothetical protein Q0M25_13465, partial [Staphylococcus aureus]|nr:hypothetical protein [Staphylococcus aureus]
MAENGVGNPLMMPDIGPVVGANATARVREDKVPHALTHEPHGCAAVVRDASMYKIGVERMACALSVIVSRMAV